MHTKELLNAPAVASARRALLATSPAGYAGCCAAIRDMDFTSALGRITAPTLVIGGDLDVSMPWPDHGGLLAASIPGAVAVRLPAAHLSSVERPRSFSAALFSFLLPAAGNRLEAGERARRAVLGDAHVDRAIQQTTALNRIFSLLPGTPPPALNPNPPSWLTPAGRKTPLPLPPAQRTTNVANTGFQIAAEEIRHAASAEKDQGRGTKAKDEGRTKDEGDSRAEPLTCQRNVRRPPQHAIPGDERHPVHDARRGNQLVGGIAADVQPRVSRARSRASAATRAPAPAPAPRRHRRDPSRSGPAATAWRSPRARRPRCSTGWQRGGAFRLRSVCRRRRAAARGCQD